MNLNYSYRLYSAKEQKEKLAETLYTVSFTTMLLKSVKMLWKKKSVVLITPTSKMQLYLYIKKAISICCRYILRYCRMF